MPQSPKSPRKGRIGQSKYAPHSLLADAINPASHDPVRTGSNSQQDEAVIEGQLKAATQYPVALDDRRFIDPLIQEIVELWRQRQDMVRAQSKLTLQIKAICRRFSGGDKSEADKLYKRIEAGEAHPAAMACAVLFMARTPLEDARKSYEKHLTKLGKQLPIAHMADSIKGIGHLALAKIVGECGDLSAYKSVAAVWKRAGLAVIEGERQRKVPGDAALLHGYSPQRRSTLWNIADPMLKAQGKDEGAGPYRKLYDAHKAAQLDKGLPLIHAHNRAMRYMTKALLKDLTLEWRRIARDPAGMPEPVGPGKHDTPRTVADRHIFMEAAE
ncbi:MAG: transposase [Betaproteobacteria bacterium]|nr:transposase [Betaproteobacteria bacterium]